MPMDCRVQLRHSQVVQNLKLPRELAMPVHGLVHLSRATLKVLQPWLLPLQFSKLCIPCRTTIAALPFLQGMYQRTALLCC